MLGVVALVYKEEPWWAQYISGVDFLAERMPDSGVIKKEIRKTKKQVKKKQKTIQLTRMLVSWFVSGYY